MSSEGPATSVDAFLGGRLTIRQPRRGHRAGIDAVLLAAACPARPGDHIADLGAATGVAGLCILSRIEGTKATLIEIDAEAAALARANVALNAMQDRAFVFDQDLTARGAAAACGFARPGADHVVANPPFEEVGRTRLSPVESRARAHAADPGMLEDWTRFAASILKPKGTFTIIHRTDALRAVLTALGPRFGALRVKPVHPRSGLPATRILVRGEKGSRAPLHILPPLILHGGEGHGFLEEPEALLRRGAALGLD
ncbi:MAG: tRNA1(Val) (adenine(37)-N6)-methyltransferase [Flavobacteriaceae bacterium]